MLVNALTSTDTMQGRSVDMKISATGDIAEAYDIYISVNAHSDINRQNGKTDYRAFVRFDMFARLIYWKTTHKKLLIGTVSILGFPDGPEEYSDLFKVLTSKFERISTPVEIKDYWKKSFEKYVVVNMANVVKEDLILKHIDILWKKDKSIAAGVDITEPSGIKHVLVYTIPISSWETSRRGEIIADSEKKIGDRCYDGPHGFVRSDTADEFTIEPTSLPVTTLIS